jgi:hypothetical protein
LFEFSLRSLIIFKSKLLNSLSGIAAISLSLGLFIEVLWVLEE